jgi:hypothetical protein
VWEGASLHCAKGLLVLRRMAYVSVVGPVDDLEEQVAERCRRRVAKRVDVGKLRHRVSAKAAGRNDLGN